MGRPKGIPKTGGRKKTIKNKKTILKEAIGLTGWKALENYILTNGSDKMLEEMSKLKGGSYGFAFREMAEYFKPKLARTEVTGEGGGPVKMDITLNLNK